MNKIAALLMASSLPMCAGWGVRLEFGYKDAKAGVELTPPLKVEPQK
jgi:hypothetical protein